MAEGFEGISFDCTLDGAFFAVSVDGSIARIGLLPELERVSAWRACRRKGTREHLKALYSFDGW